MDKYCFLVGELNSANGICALEIMKELSSSGKKVICITNRDPGTKKEEVMEGIKILRITPRLSYRFFKKHEQTKKNIYKLSANFLNKFKLLLSILTWPFLSPLYTLRFFHYGKKTIKRNDANIVIPIYTQIDTVIASYFLKKKFPQIKYIPYFLDSLSGGHGPKYFSQKQIIKRGLWWESKLLKNADRIVVMESSREHHKKYSCNKSYYDKIFYADIPLYNPNITYAKYANNFGLLSENSINIVFVGSIPCDIRNPKVILEIFSSLEIPHVSLNFIGSNTCPKLFEEFKKMSKYTTINLIDSVSHDMALKYLSEADILLNIGNSLENMIPSKIFEYMSYCKPIITTIKIKKDPTIPYLKKYGNVLIVDEMDYDLEIIKKQITIFINNLDDNGYDINILKKMFYKNTPQYFLELINFNTEGE